MRLISPFPTIHVVEKQEMVRRRIFSVRSLDDIPTVLQKLKGERFMGSVKFNIGPGGTPNSVEVEDRAKI